jgi:NDP-sugar pyrophosphorylase family protein
MSTNSKDRVRITISLSKELADQVDRTVDGLHVRNRSHAIESLLSDALGMVCTDEVVILAGGEEAEHRIPAIKTILKSLTGQGITKAVIAVGFLGNVIKDRIGNGAEFNMNIRYLTSDQGTGGALRQMKNHLSRTFLVVNVLQPISLDLKQLFKFHRDHQAIVTIATNSLKELHGVYIMEPKVFTYIPEGYCMLEDTVFHDIAQQGKLLSYPINS